MAKFQVNSENYRQLLKRLIATVFIDRYFILFQNGSASSHTCKLTQEYLEKSAQSFIREAQLPLMSPSLNHTKCAVWNALSAVHAGRKEKFPEAKLNTKLRVSWENISLEEILKTNSSMKKG